MNHQKEAEEYINLPVFTIDPPDPEEVIGIAQTHAILAIADYLREIAEALGIEQP